ncbi:MAG: serine/threonine protein kinase [Myxococcales bacterium]|nr:serine/threonine protein kinase [Myxococcales bacterium]
MQSGPVTSPDPASMTPGMILAGRYRLERPIGSGGFGTVFAAVNLNTGGRVALKVLSPRVLEMAGGAERFRREAELARRLDHPNIVRVLDAGTDPSGALFIGFELLEGCSLQDEIQRRGAFPARRAAAVCVEVLAALEHAHANGVVHRDLKPANVFLLGGARDGAVKVLDFGIAKSTNAGTRAGLTQEGTAIGTPAYMAPEQLEGQEVGPAADLYSLGVLLAEMLAGRPLFSEDASPIQILTARLTRGLPIPESVSASPLGPVIARATQPDRTWRYANARQMRAELEAATAGLPSESFHTGDHRGTGPTAFGGAPTAVDATARSPVWAAQPSPPHGAPPLPAAAPRSSSSAGVIVALVAVLGLAAVGAGVFFVASARSDASRNARADAREEDEDDERPKKKKKREDDAPKAPAPKPALPPPDPPRPDPNPPQQDPEPPPPELGRSAVCPGIPAVPAGLRTSLTQAGFEISGTLLYCAGDMVNFQCLGPRGDGFTVEGGGNAALLRMKSAAEAEAFAKKEAAGAKKAQTYFYDSSRVVRVEMPAADADRLRKKLCKG